MPNVDRVLLKTIASHFKPIAALQCRLQSIPTKSKAQASLNRSNISPDAFL